MDQNKNRPTARWVIQRRDGPGTGWVSITEPSTYRERVYQEFRQYQGDPNYRIHKVS